MSKPVSGSDSTLPSCLAMRSSYSRGLLAGGPLDCHDEVVVDASRLLLVRLHEAFERRPPVAVARQVDDAELPRGGQVAAGLAGWRMTKSLTALIEPAEYRR